MAILQVVLYHYFATTDVGPHGGRLEYFVKLFAFGWTGVDLFFVLSGFLIGGILLEYKAAPQFFRAFYLRRIHRILPVYLLWISIYVVILSLPAHWFPAALDVAGSTLSVVPKYLLFVQNFFFQEQHFQWVWFAVSWSLAIEEQFYLVAPPLVRFLSGRLLKWAVGLTIVLAPVLRVFLFTHFASRWHFLAVQLMPCRADELAIGVGCAMLWRVGGVRRFLVEHKRLLYQVLAALSCAILIAMWWFLHPVSTVRVGVGYSLLALFYASLMLVVLADASGLLARLMRLRFLRYLGGISYCVYLIHIAVNFLCHSFLLHSKPRITDWPGVAVTALAALLTVLLAELSWRYFERPMVRRGHSYSY